MRRIPPPVALQGTCLVAVLFALNLPPAEAASFTGSEICSECHATHYQQVTNSIHSKMIRVNAHLPGVIHGDLRKPNAPTTNDVHWVMGGWYKEESYIRTNWTGSNWTYTVTQFEWNPITGNYANDRPLRDWLTRCAGCHTTGYDPGTRRFVELNIRCEACHGPGSDHVDSYGAEPMVIDRSAEGCGFCHIRAENAETAQFPAKTFNFPIGYVLGQPSTLQFVPEPLSATASFFPDGTSRRHRQQYLDMHYPGVRQTPHYTQGISCVKCHNPHTAGTVSIYSNGLPPKTYGIKIYDNVNGATNYVAWDGGRLWHPTAHTNISAQALCKTCHTSVQDHHVHQFSAAALAAEVTCIDCHMPDVINVDSTTRRGALRPHTFASMMPANSLKYGASAQPNSCTYSCHQDKGTNAATRALWADSILTLRVAPLISFGHPFEMRVVGTPEYQYALDASSDFRTWMPLSTNTAAALPNYTPRWGFEVSDPDSAGFDYRFYRARRVYPVP